MTTAPPTNPDVQANLSAARRRVQQQPRPGGGGPASDPATPKAQPRRAKKVTHRARVTPPDDAPGHLNRIIRERDLFAFCGLRKTQVATLIRNGEFPKPIKLSESGRAKGWLESELIAWQTKRLVKREAGQ